MLSEKALIKAAKELNDVLGLDPPIATRNAKIEDLIHGLKEGMELIDPKQDEITEETQNVLDELNGSPVTEEQEETKEQEETEETPIKEKREPKSGAKEEKKTTKASKTELKEEKKGAKKTRASVMKDILYGPPKTSKEMIEEMHRRYGGSEAEAAFQTNIFLRILMELDLLEAVEGNKLKYIGR